MATVTNIDIGSTEWIVNDQVIQLREWGSSRIHVLPPPAPVGEWTIGAAKDCWLHIDDESRRTSQYHAQLSFDGKHWCIQDRKNKNGISQDGARQSSFLLTPGVEVGIGGKTYIAESPRFITLRGLMARLLGYGDESRRAVDLALRAVRDAARRKNPLLLIGKGDLISIARMVHRRSLGPEAPFVLCDRRRRSSNELTWEDLPVANSARQGMANAAGGTLCAWRNSLPEDFLEVREELRQPASRVQLVLCATTSRSNDLLGNPVNLPPLAERSSELDQVIREYTRDACAELELPASQELSPLDFAWIRQSETADHATLEEAVRRVLALRGNDNSVTRAANRLRIRHSTLSEWCSRRTQLKI